MRKALEKRGSDLEGRQLNVDVATERKRDGGGSFGGGSYGDRPQGGNRPQWGNRPQGGGGFRGNNARSAAVSLTEDDKNAKKGSIGTFKGKITRL